MVNETNNCYSSFKLSFVDTKYKFSWRVQFDPILCKCLWLLVWISRGSTQARRISTPDNFLFYFLSAQFKLQHLWSNHFCGNGCHIFDFFNWKLSRTIMILNNPFFSITYNRYNRWRNMCVTAGGTPPPNTNASIGRRLPRWASKLSKT